MPKYVPPAVEAERWQSSQTSHDLTPTTPVTVVFRGGPQIVDLYDSIEHRVPPGDYPKGTILPAQTGVLEYQVAKHLQARAIVPGTRNPFEGTKAISQLGILGIDKDERCVPLSADLLARFRPGVEGIDRSQFLDSRRAVKVVGTADALAQVMASGSDIEGALEAPPDPEALAVPAQHRGLAEMEADAAAAAQVGLAGGRARRR